MSNITEKRRRTKEITAESELSSEETLHKKQVLNQVSSEFNSIPLNISQNEKIVPTRENEKKKSKKKKKKKTKVRHKLEEENLEELQQEDREIEKEDVDENIEKPKPRQLDIEDFPEDEVFLFSKGANFMLVKVTRKDILFPKSFLKAQTLARRKDTKDTPKEDPNLQGFADDPTILKYWAQRFFLFSKYEQGIKLDRESWYSATPESIAKHIASRVEGSATVIDAFCGAGGNSIQFAKKCEYVISNDIDPVYGVWDKITTTNFDFLNFEIEEENIDFVFLAPPWGGTNYCRSDYSIFEHVYPDIRATLEKAFEYSQNVILLLGRNTLLSEIVQLFSEYFEKYDINPYHSGIEIEKIYVKGKLKEIAVYYGDFSSIERSVEIEYLYSRFENPLEARRILKKSLKSHGIRKFLDWLRKREKKENLSTEEAIEFNNYIKEGYKAQNEDQ